MKYVLVMQIIGLTSAFIASASALLSLVKRSEAQKSLERKLSEILDTNSSGVQTTGIKDRNSIYLSCSKNELEKYRKLIEQATKELSEEHRKSIKRALNQPSKKGKKSFIYNTVKHAMQV